MADTKETIFLGITDAAGNTIAIISKHKGLAERTLYKKWRSQVWEGFQPDITNFAQLHEWNGAAVKEVPLDVAFDWMVI